MVDVGCLDFSHEKLGKHGFQEHLPAKTCPNKLSSDSTCCHGVPEVACPAQLYSVFPLIMLITESKMSGPCRWPQLRRSYPPRRVECDCDVWSSKGHRQTRNSCDRAGEKKCDADGKGGTLPYQAATPD